jgi:hypothetical protein
VLTTLQIVDISGRIIETLINGEFLSGEHKIQWNAGNQPSGVYFIRLESGEKLETQKIVFMK